MCSDKMGAYFVLLFLQLIFLQIVMAQLNCTDYKGNIITNGKEFIPKENDLCHVCMCEAGYGTACRSVTCKAPVASSSCKNWVQIKTECCHFECVGRGSKDYGNMHNSTTVNLADGSESNITTVGLRLVGSTVTCFFILALLLFIIHRLRRKRLLVEMRRYNSRREQAQDADDSLTPEYFGIECPPYEDPPPPYSPPKPGNRHMTYEAPPPYDSINNNISNVGPQQPHTISRLVTNHGFNGLSTYNPRLSQMSHMEASLQQAFNAELRESMQRHQNMRISSSSESSDLDPSEASTIQSSRLSQDNSPSDTGVCVGHPLQNEEEAGHLDDQHMGSRGSQYQLRNSHSFNSSASSCPSSVIPHSSTENQSLVSANPQSLLDRFHAACHTVQHGKPKNTSSNHSRSSEGPTEERLQGYYPPSFDSEATYSSDDDSSFNSNSPYKLYGRNHGDIRNSSWASTQAHTSLPCRETLSSSNGSPDSGNSSGQLETSCTRDCRQISNHQQEASPLGPSAICSETGENDTKAVSSPGVETLDNDAQYPDHSFAVQKLMSRSYPPGEDYSEEFNSTNKNLKRQEGKPNTVMKPRGEQREVRTLPAKNSTGVLPVQGSSKKKMKYDVKGSRKLKFCENKLYCSNENANVKRNGRESPALHDFNGTAGLYAVSNLISSQCPKVIPDSHILPCDSSQVIHPPKVDKGEHSEGRSKRNSRAHKTNSCGSSLQLRNSVETDCSPLSVLDKNQLIHQNQGRNRQKTLKMTKSMV